MFAKLFAQILKSLQIVSIKNKLEALQKPTQLQTMNNLCSKSKTLHTVCVWLKQEKYTQLQQSFPATLPDKASSRKLERPKFSVLSARSFVVQKALHSRTNQGPENSFSLFFLLPPNIGRKVANKTRQKVDRFSIGEARGNVRLLRAF